MCDRAQHRAFSCAIPADEAIAPTLIEHKVCGAQEFGAVKRSQIHVLDLNVDLRRPKLLPCLQINLKRLFGLAGTLPSLCFTHYCAFHFLPSFCLLFAGDLSSQVFTWLFAVYTDTPILHVPYLFACLGKKVFVVGHYNGTSTEELNGLSKCLHGLKVKIIRRLIEGNDVGFYPHRRSNHELTFLASREGSYHTSSCHMF
mmetsp:Transcript_45674/g.87820  ORF Transcript_45674/g.87820 Transcript_45674/m.87820 type:complete len:200 (-) Transcript_45674:833-1432(-)